MKFKLPDLHNRKTQLALGGAGAVVALALYRRHAAGAATGGVQGTSVGSISDPVASDAFGASTLENNIVGDLQPQINWLSAQIAGLKAAKPTPPLPKPKTPVPAKPPAKTPVTGKTLPQLNSANYSMSASVSSPTDPLALLGTIGAGHVYTGENVKGGAPVYALLPGATKAVQNFNWKTAPAGTKVFTLKRLSSYIVPKQVSVNVG